MHPARVLVHRYAKGVNGPSTIPVPGSARRPLRLAESLSTLLGGWLIYRWHSRLGGSEFMGGTGGDGGSETRFGIFPRVVGGQRRTPLVSQIAFDFQAILIAQKTVEHDELRHLSLG